VSTALVVAAGGSGTDRVQVVVSVPVVVVVSVRRSRLAGGASAPYPEALVGAQRYVGQAVLGDRAAGADHLRRAGALALLGVEDLGVGLGAQRLVVQVLRVCGRGQPRTELDAVVVGLGGLWRAGSGSGSGEVIAGAPHESGLVEWSSGGQGGGARRDDAGLAFWGAAELFDVAAPGPAAGPVEDLDGVVGLAAVDRCSGLVDGGAQGGLGDEGLAFSVGGAGEVPELGVAHDPVAGELVGGVLTDDESGTRVDLADPRRHERADVGAGVMFSVGAEQVQRRDHGAGVFEAESVAVEHVE